MLISALPRRDTKVIATGLVDRRLEYVPTGEQKPQFTYEEFVQRSRVVFVFPRLPNLEPKKLEFYSAFVNHDKTPTSLLKAIYENDLSSDKQAFRKLTDLLETMSQDTAQLVSKYDLRMQVNHRYAGGVDTELAIYGFIIDRIKDWSFEKIKERVYQLRFRELYEWKDRYELLKERLEGDELRACFAFLTAACAERHILVGKTGFVFF